MGWISQALQLLRSAIVGVHQVNTGFGIGGNAGGTSITNGASGGNGANSGFIYTPPSSLRDVALQASNLQGTDGGTTLSLTAPTTIVIAAANLIRVESLGEIGSTVKTVEDGLNSEISKWLRYAIEIEAWANSPFALVPFVAFLENGESIAATNNAGYDVSVAIETATGAQNKLLVYGPTAVGKMIMDGGTARWLTKITIDVANLMDSYAKYYREKEMAEENAGPLYLGIGAVGQASLTINYDLKQGWAYAVKPRKTIISA